MALVSVQVNGRAFKVSCDNGEEAHVRELGQHLDKEVQALAATAGPVGDTKLLLLAGLVIADQLFEARTKLEERDKELLTLKAEYAGALQTQESREESVAQSLDGAAMRIEAIAARLQRA